MANKTIGSIRYSLSARLSKPNDKSSEKKIYAVAQTNEVVDMRMFADHISEHNSVFSTGTVYGLLRDVAGCLREQLLAGNRVNLAGLGTFFLSIKSEGCDNADDFAAMHIRSVNVRFTPDPELKGLIQFADFEQVSSRKEQASARKLGKQNLNSRLNTQAGGEATGG